jgi:hypothetical protein
MRHLWPDPGHTLSRREELDLLAECRCGACSAMGVDAEEVPTRRERAAKPVGRDLFPFVYVGGGYFRRAGVPRGDVAEMLHGQQVVEYLLAAADPSRSRTTAHDST